jgi:DNA repair exonuclease SbcCD ATPase subunit
MSIRSRSSAAPEKISAVEFKSEFLNAAPAARDDTVSNILSRLDQLQASINPDSSAPTPAAKATTARAKADPADLHSRLEHLESIHEDTLHQLGAKLSPVEAKIRDNKEAEHLMGQISAKFSLIESRLQSQSRLHERVTEIETQLRPDPEQERILARINAKLDLIEEQKRSRAEPRAAALGSRFDEHSAHDPDRAEYLHQRIAKLQALRARYAGEEDDDVSE